MDLLCIALERHCRVSGNSKFIITAEDKVKNTGDIPERKMKLTITGLNDEATKILRMWVELAVKMKVVLNIRLR